MKLWCLFLAVFVSNVISCSLCAKEKIEAEPIYADCHVHLLDFLQNGEFLNSDNKFPGDVYGHQKDGGRFVSLPYGERGRRIENQAT